MRFSHFPRAAEFPHWQGSAPRAASPEPSSGDPERGRRGLSPPLTAGVAPSHWVALQRRLVAHPWALTHSSSATLRRGKAKLALLIPRLCQEVGDTP